MKRIVETTGSFMLVDPTYGGIIWDDRPCVVKWSSFFEARTGAGEIRVLHTDLPEEATDEEFLEYLNDAGKADLAVASFVSKFTESKPTPQTKKTPKAKPAKEAEEE